MDTLLHVTLKISRVKKKKDEKVGKMRARADDIFLAQEN
jgi:hypothetical protein